MKKLFTLGVILAAGSFGSQLLAQINQLPQKEMDYPITSDFIDIDGKRASKNDFRKGGETTYFSEDFSNGLDGQGANGAWTLTGAQGELWFQAFPSGSAEGYSPTGAVQNGENPLYNNQIPNYFGTRTTIQSTTADNGFMMVDGDRYNSTSTTETPGTLSQNPFVAQLISPPMDLSAASDGALLVFQQYVRHCCNFASFVSVDFSFDGGDTWIPFNVFTPFGGVVNVDLQLETTLCLNEIIQSATDLSAVRFRFNWSGPQSQYFWMVDDIAILARPINDISIGTVWYGRHIEAQFEDNTAAEYYSTFEYEFTPDYFVKPLQFGAVVTNDCAQEPQTNIVLHVSIEGPDGETLMTTTSTENIVSLESGTSDTVWTELTFPGPWSSDVAQFGEYTISYEVIQDQEDERPEDNIGDTRRFNISNDNENDGFAIAQNNSTTYFGTFLDYGQDAIWSTPYVFPESQVGGVVITHVEAVFLNQEGFAQSQAGEIVYFNVRDGAILDEDPDDPSTTTGVFFDQANPLQYESSDLEYVIEEEDLWVPSTGFPQNWASFELPSPILVEAGRVYQAEYRVPAAETGVVFPPTSHQRTEAFSSLFYLFSDQGWFSIGNSGSLATRFRTAFAETVSDKLSYERGIKLTQNYPNPFHADTRIQYQLDESSDVRLNVHDISGKLMFSDYLGLRNAGTAYIYDFQRRDLAAGVYTYTISTNRDQVTRKMIVE